jgi:hypothetical protein
MVDKGNRDPKVRPKIAMPNFEQVIASPTAAYDEGLAFFRGHGMLNHALVRIVADLERNGIGYAVIGAIALNQHGYKRFTEDIDLLMSKEGLQQFRDRLVGSGYIAAFPGATRRFKTSQDNIKLEIVISGEYPGDGKPKAVVFPRPEQSSEIIAGVRTVSLAKLMELKLASGMTAPDRLKDLADVQEMIKIKGLKADFAQTLDPSVRDKFRELYQAVERAKSPEPQSEP